jgi:hypothetical protein
MTIPIACQTTNSMTDDIINSKIASKDPHIDMHHKMKVIPCGGVLQQMPCTVQLCVDKRPTPVTLARILEHWMHLLSLEKG